MGDGSDRLHVDEADAGEIVKGVKDLYIRRLMDGVGWKQTEYNGPNLTAKDSLLAPYGGNVGEYLRAQYFDAADGSSTNTTGASGSTPNP